MNIESLRKYIVLSEQRSITSAAKALYISQQGLNKIVTSLEDELGCQLLTRSRRGTSLTGEGLVFLEHAKRIVAEYDAALEDASSASASRRVLSQAPYALAATSLCIERVVRPMSDSGLLGNTSIREVGIEEARRIALSEPSSIVLIDYFDFSERSQSVLDGLGFRRLITADMGLLYDKNSFSFEDCSGTSALEGLPLGVVDAETMRVYLDAALSEDAVSRQTRLLTRQVGILLNAASNGSVIVPFDSLSFAEMEMTGRDLPPNLAFSRIGRHTCQIGFVLVPDTEKAKLSYIESFAESFNLFALRHGLIDRPFSKT